MKFLFHVVKFILHLIYAVLKFFPLDGNKILFLSRQSNKLSLDFKLLQEKLLSENPNLKIVAICHRLDDRKKGLVGFAVDMLRSMYHLATSKVCVLDAYWPAVSLLEHREELTVIQMWHAAGKIKKSGYQTLGKPGGRNTEMANLLAMHKNYDYIIAGGKAWNPYYCASFGVSEDKLVNIGLPRIDYLISTEQENKKKVYSVYPELQEKEIILYAPTFRRHSEIQWHELEDQVDFDRYHLIIKYHPNHHADQFDEKVYLCPEFQSIELLSVCDYLITDYSAISVEAAVLNKKTYYYLFDYNHYSEDNGLNVNPFEAMPGCTFTDPAALMASLSSGEYNQKALDQYREKYLPENLGTSTAQLTELILKQINPHEEVVCEAL